jgi:hypothetical protein
MEFAGDRLCVRGAVVILTGKCMNVYRYSE